MLLTKDAWRSAALLLRFVVDAVVRAGLEDVSAALAIHESTHAETVLVLIPVSSHFTQQ